ncbi:MAG: LUD domain-containing protein, partial [Actinomycetota bacterium]
MSESADRARFLARIAARQGPPVAAGPHPPPPEPTIVPEVRVRSVEAVAAEDTEALLDVFVAAAESVGTVVHRGDTDAAVAAIADRHDATTAVLSPEPAAQGLVGSLDRAGVTPRPLETGEAAIADLGVTGCVAAIAATGSVVIDADRAGSRTTSLLPRVHV